MRIRILFRLRLVSSIQPKLTHFYTKGGTGSGLPESTPEGFCVFLSDPESKICYKPDPVPESLFHSGSCRSLCLYFLGKNIVITVGSMIVAGVWTGVGFSNLKNSRTRFRNRIPKFWNRSGVGVWKNDSDHLCFTLRKWPHKHLLLAKLKSDSRSGV